MWPSTAPGTGEAAGQQVPQGQHQGRAPRQRKAPPRSGRAARLSRSRSDRRLKMAAEGSRQRQAVAGTVGRIRMDNTGGTR